MQSIPAKHYALVVLLSLTTLYANAATVRYSYYGADSSTFTATNYIIPGNGEDPSPIPVTSDYRISGWVELGSPLAANLINADISNSLSDWAFDRNILGGSINRTDYQQLINQFGGTCTNPEVCFNLTVSTDSQGNITEWALVVSDLIYDKETYKSRFSLTPSLPNGDSGAYTYSIWLGGGYTGYSNYTSASVGSWSGPTVVPIPGAAWLFVSALGLMGWRSRR